jgi:[ribosomal protein S5]-alanine N-acetyltransferase
MQISLEKPSLKGQREFLAAVKRSRRLHHPWVAAPATPKAFSNYAKRFKSPVHIIYWVRTETGKLAGVIHISEIVRGNLQSAYLGYYAFSPHNGRGYMTLGLKAVVKEAFRKLGLHRLEANIQPGNKSSRRLVQRLGFRKEGFSPRYVKIAGRWRDHERWALTKEDWRGAKTL